MTMTEPRLATRRATVEDLPQLMPLWRLERLPADALEKRFTEFQIVSDDAGRVLAAIGIQIAGAQGFLHSESIAQAELSDTLRELLWKRLQVIIQNHALERLWTHVSGHFWDDCGFARASDEQLKTRPAAFQGGEQEWRVMTLRAGNAAAALERDFAEIKAMQQQEVERMRERIRWMKRIALGVTVFVFILVIAWAVVMLKFGPKLFHGR